MPIDIATRTIVRSTERFHLVHFELADASFIVSLLNDDAFLRFIGDRGVRTEEDALAYLDGVRGSYETHGFGLWLVVVSNEPVGMCGLLKRGVLDHPDIGFAFLSAYRGQGLAQEAARTTLDWAQENGIGTVEAVVSPENVRSTTLLQTLGFQPAGKVTLTPGADPILHFTRTA